MTKLVAVLLIIIITSSNAFALFDDKAIEPYLGPYKLEAPNRIDKSGEICPKTLLLTAECTLSELSLRKADDHDFSFLTFSGINEGELVTRIKKQIIEKSNTTFNDLKIISTQESYLKRYSSWCDKKTELILGEKKFTLKKYKRKGKAKEYTTILHCDYNFDDNANNKMIEEFKAQTSSTKN